MDIVSELTRIYYEEEKGYDTYLEPKQAEKYFKKLLEKERIVYLTGSRDTDTGSVVAYCEFWTITYDQLPKALTSKLIPETEDINTGPICYISSLCVREGYRTKDMVRKIKNMILDKCPDIEYFAGLELKKKRRLRYYKVRR